MFTVVSFGGLVVCTEHNVKTSCGKLAASKVQKVVDVRVKLHGWQRWRRILCFVHYILNNDSYISYKPQAFAIKESVDKMVCEIKMLWWSLLYIFPLGYFFICGLYRFHSIFHSSIGRHAGVMCQFYVGVTPVLRRYYTCVTSVLHLCYVGVTPVLRRCYTCVTSVLHQCYAGFCRT